MSFFDGVRECNQRNGGTHRWGAVQREPELRLGGQVGGGRDHYMQCGESDCGVKVWGKTPGQAMANAQEFDRANRSWRLW